MLSVHKCHKNLPAIIKACCGVALMICVAAAQQPLRPVPDTGGANLPAQRVGPNDLIGVSVYDAPELSRTVRVGSDGMMRLPMLKQPIKAQGLMPGDLENVIASALTADGLIVDPSVTVTVVEYTSRPISVVGAVKQPLTFQAIGPVTLLEALARAGGLSPEAGAEILVSHVQANPGDQAGLVRRIPVRGLIDAADPELNIPLTGGEEIRVPEVGKVFVVGNVKHPGAFPAVDGTQSSVLKMLAMAEGLERFACNEAYIYRREANGQKNEIQIPLNKIMERKSPDVPLLANDILYIPDNKSRRATFGALEKLLLFSTGVTSAAIYGISR